MNLARPFEAVVLVTVVALGWGAGGAWAQSQAGGLPAVDVRVSTLEAIAVTLQGAVTTLTTKVTVLETANAALGSALAAETAARAAADAALQTALGQETAARKSGDDGLAGSLVTEGLTRASKDQELVGLISASRSKAFSTFKHHAGLVNGARAEVGAVGPLPAGSYLVIGKATVRNSDHDATWGCDLQRDDGVYIDGTTTATDSSSPHTSSTVSLALTTFAGPGSVKMICGTGEAGSDLFDVAMTAVQIGEASIACPNIIFACPGD